MFSPPHKVVMRTRGSVDGRRRRRRRRHTEEPRGMLNKIARRRRCVGVCQLVCQPSAGGWFHVYINLQLKTSDETRVKGKLRSEKSFKLKSKSVKNAQQ